MFSQELVLNFIKHREDVMENILMLSAVYLDPRFSFELTDSQREMAIMNLTNIHQRLTRKYPQNIACRNALGIRTPQPLGSLQCQK